MVYAPLRNHNVSCPLCAEVTVWSCPFNILIPEASCETTDEPRRQAYTHATVWWHPTYYMRLRHQDRRHHHHHCRPIKSLLLKKRWPMLTCRQLSAHPILLQVWRTYSGASRFNWGLKSTSRILRVVTSSNTSHVSEAIHKILPEDRINCCWHT